MIPEHTYKFFESVIPPHICDSIIEVGLSLQPKIAVTGNLNQENLSNDDLINLQKIRRSNVSWLEGEWIYRWIRPYVQEANKQWKYDINSVEKFQFTIYQQNQFYDWHPDYFPSDKSSVRKISLSLSLSEPKEYEGGDLEFIVEDVPEKRHSIICNELKSRGSLVIFPSYVIHKVNPVTSGTRYSLVMWHEGPRWR